jgi:hypothetical protein
MIGSEGRRTFWEKAATRLQWIELVWRLRVGINREVIGTGLWLGGTWGLLLGLTGLALPGQEEVCSVRNKQAHDRSRESCTRSRDLLNSTGIIILLEY